MMETPEQRVARRMQAIGEIQFSFDGSDGPTYKVLDAVSDDTIEAIAQAIAASDKEAKWPFDPKTHVTEIERLEKAFATQKEYERHMEKRDRDIQAVVAAAQAVDEKWVGKLDPKGVAIKLREALKDLRES